MKKVIKDMKNIRKSHNESLIRRMKSGEPLWLFDSKASWFPPRPIIEKDPEAISRLYGGPYTNESTTAPSMEKRAALKAVERQESHDDGKVTHLPAPGEGPFDQAG